MQKMEAKYGIVFVIAAGNDDLPTPDFPGVWALQDLENMIVVGASTKDGQKAKFSNYGDYLTLYGPGQDLAYPEDWPARWDKDPLGARGTSFGMLRSTPPAIVYGYDRTVD